MIEKNLSVGQRISHQGDEPFEMLSREVLQGVKDMDALAMWCYLRSLPESWIIREKHVREHFGIGRDKYQKAMKSLRDLGLVDTVIRKGDDGRIQDRELTVFRSFSGAADSRKNRQPENPATGKTGHLENTDLLEKTQKRENTQGELLSGKGSEASAKPEQDDGFDQFWSIYPRRVAKPRAQTAWRNLSKADRKAVMIILSRDPYGDTESRFIPYPTTYLNQRRWEDQDQQVQPKSAATFNMGGML